MNAVTVLPVQEKKIITAKMVPASIYVLTAQIMTAMVIKILRIQTAEDAGNVLLAIAAILQPHALHPVQSVALPQEFATPPKHVPVLLLLVHLIPM